MVDIQTVSIAIASASVVVGVIYYVWQIRHQTRMRKTDLIVRITPWLNISPKEMMENANTVMTSEYKDCDDFVQKYGSLFSGEPVANAVRMLLNWAEGVGMLLKRNLVDIDIVSDAYGVIVPAFWEKVKPLVEGYRKETTNPRWWEYLEYLYNEVKEREQQQASKKA